MARSSRRSFPSSPLKIDFRTAETEAERRAVYRFRYDVYVEEMGRYRDAADHEQRLLAEPEDEHSRIFYAREGDEVIATSRFTWGGDGPFSPRQIEHYRLESFLAEVAVDAIAVAERGMVTPRLRGTDVFSRLGAVSSRFVNGKRIQLVFGACEPHLLSLYLGYGSRAYAAHNINSKEAGYLIPIVNVVEDVDYLRRIGSPRADKARDFGADARIPECVTRLISSHATVTSRRLTAPHDYWDQVHGALSALDGAQISAFAGLTEEQAERVLNQSNIIECGAGDRVLKKGGVARNLFIVLSGTLEVRDGGKLIAMLGPGDVFGEMAFLLETPRTRDVYAVTEDVRILSLSEGTVRALIDTDSKIAANMLLNVAKMLCLRLIKSG